MKFYAHIHPYAEEPRRLEVTELLPCIDLPVCLENFEAGDPTKRIRFWLSSYYRSGGAAIHGHYYTGGPFAVREQV